MARSRLWGDVSLGNLERSASGGIYFTRVKGTCPRCSAPMRMVADHHFICQDSFDHMLKFDMTTLPDVAEDYARRRSGGDANRGGGDDTSAHDDDTGAREKCVLRRWKCITCTRVHTTHMYVCVQTCMRDAELHCKVNFRNP